MAAVKARIAQVEADFNSFIAEKEAEHAQKVEDLTKAHEAELVEIENKTVDSLVGKILG